jgi:SAM-dependent methyltransferase
VADIEFYASLLPDKRTRLLEIGCGTGRVLQELAQRDYQHLIGVDKIAQMLEFARAKLEGRAVELYQLDMGRRLRAADRKRIGQLDAILIPFNTFHEIGPVERRRRCLENCFALLADDGQIVVDSRIPSFFRQGTRNIREKFIRTFVDSSGHYVEYFVSLKGDFVQQTLKGYSTYRVYDCADGDLKQEYHTPIQSWFTKPSEFALCAELCRLRIVHQWGGYDRTVYRPNSERYIAVLQRM